MLKITICSSRQMEPLTPALALYVFPLIRSSVNNLKTLHFSPFHLYTQHTTWWIQNEGAKSAVLSVMMVEDYKRSFTNHFLSSLRSTHETASSVPNCFYREAVFAIKSLSAYLPYRNVCCSHLSVNMCPWWHWKTHHLLPSHSCMFNTRTQLLIEISKTPSLSKYTRDCFPLLGIVLSLLTSVFCQRFELVSSTKWTHSSP